MITGVGGVSPANVAGQWVCQLHGWPLWSQLADWVWSGEVDINRTDNCNMECDAAVIMYLRSVELPADYIKDVEYGRDFVGYTDFNHSAHFLARYCSIQSSIIQASTQQELGFTIWNSLVHGHPIKGIRAFSNPTATDRHVVCFVRIDSQYVYHHDPWTGTIVREDYETAFSWHKDYLQRIHAVKR